MAINETATWISAFGAAALFLLPACDSGGDASESSGSTGGTTTGVVDPSGSSTSGVDPSATSSTSTTTVDPTEATSSTTADESSSSSGGSSSTGEPVDCVDEDIGSAVGQEVVVGQNEGQGDDFSLRYCSGGAGSSTVGTDTVGPDDTGDPTDPTGMSSATSGVGSTTGGLDGEGDDFVVSWTPPSTGPFTIDTFGSGIDTVLTVVQPECGATRGECNDDCNGLESGLVYEATEGETVYIVIEGYGGRQGEFQLNIAEGGELECGGIGSTGEIPDTDGGMTSVGTSP